MLDVEYIAVDVEYIAVDSEYTAVDVEYTAVDIEYIAVDVAKTNRVAVKLVGIEAVELRGATSDRFGDIVVNGEVNFAFALVFENRVLNGLNEVAVCEAETKTIVTFAVVFEARLLNGLDRVVDCGAMIEALVDIFVKDREVTTVRETWPGFIGTEVTDHGLREVKIMSMRVTKRELLIGAMVTALRNTFLPITATFSSDERILPIFIMIRDFISEQYDLGTPHTYVVYPLHSTFQYEECLWRTLGVLGWIPQLPTPLNILSYFVLNI